MADIMLGWVKQNLIEGRGVNRLDNAQRPKSPEIKMIFVCIVRNYATLPIIFRAMPITINSPLHRWLDSEKPVC
jgi:CDP-diacylglycerol--serine O-phosphatidyltransferase